jgi:hypothetical protein
MLAMLQSKKLSFRLVPASAMLAIAAVCWSPVASAGALTNYLTGIGVNTTTDLGNNDRTSNLWTPTTAGVAFEVVDYSGGNLRTGAGYGGQPYDLEALYVQKVGNDLKITGVAGANFALMQSLAACAGPTPCTAGITSTYGMGDFFLGSKSGTTYSPKIGLETTGQNFTMNGSGNTNGYTTPLAAGALVGLSGTVTTGGTVTAASGWETGLSNWAGKPAPSQIATSGYTANSSSALATMAYETLGGSHYIYQATITNFAALGLGSDITVHWGEICGNDWLRTTADVPLPSSLALFLLGGAGLAAGTRRRRV